MKIRNSELLKNIYSYLHFSFNLNITAKSNTQTNGFVNENKKGKDTDPLGDVL